MSDKQYNRVEFRTNIHETIVFNYDTPREHDGKFGKSYSYGVSWNGVEAFLNATPLLHRKLQGAREYDLGGVLYGKQLVIVKEEYHDEKDNKVKKRFIVTDINGREVGTRLIDLPNEEPAPQSSTGNPDFRAWAEKMVKELNDLKARVTVLEAKDILNDRPEIKG